MEEIKLLEEIFTRLMKRYPKKAVVVDCGYRSFWGEKPVFKYYVSIDFEGVFFETKEKLVEWVDEKTHRGKEIIFRKFK